MSARTVTIGSQVQTPSYLSKHSINRRSEQCAKLVDPTIVNFVPKTRAFWTLKSSAGYLKLTPRRNGLQG
ncbi:hypothetical protein CEXT_622821 [Caerostris extrusa]|uniref:Uncharacterized protein n=1 Tax=Caerostris extrusa TaxID=172846 RepID=A0AAV4URR9_CAEEX|nr:hypothetical protein CEXT_622821 [Caerostris extrusa]